MVKFKVGDILLDPKNGDYWVVIDLYADRVLIKSVNFDIYRREWITKSNLRSLLSICKIILIPGCKLTRLVYNVD